LALLMLLAAVAPFAIVPSARASTFHKGATIRIELLAQERPPERPAPRPFAVTVSDFTIELPAHAPPDGGEIVKPVLGRAR
jgi:hypothetical protein